MNKNKLLQKAKEKEYKHRIWFTEGGKSIYEVMEYLVNNSSISIDLKTTINHISAIPGYDKESRERKDIIQYCIDNFEKHWDKLIINSSSRGTDKGKFKLQVYMTLAGIKYNSKRDNSKNNNFNIGDHIHHIQDKIINGEHKRIVNKDRTDKITGITSDIYSDTRYMTKEINFEDKPRIGKVYEKDIVLV